MISSKRKKLPLTNFLSIIIIINFIFSQVQSLQFDGLIETRKLFLFGPDNGFQFNQFGSTHNFLFQNTFDNVPRVGLAVYTVDFEYSPDFSCRITSDTNKTSTAIKIISMSTNQNNRIYIMYLATDHQQMGVFVPDRLYTDKLSLPTRTSNIQSFGFNFKQQISQRAKSFNQISITIYLTGLSTTSEMTNNGYPSNRTSINLRTIHSSTRFYNIQVSIGEQYPFILIDWVECTVLYFIPTILFDNKYQINSGLVTLKSYGGTRQPVQKSTTLIPLSKQDKFQNLQFFYGISTIQCQDGISITLLGVEKFFTTTEDPTVKLLLQMQTWKLTFIDTSSFNYLQYKKLRCNQTGANCKQKCGDGVKPYFMVENNCNYCHFSCQTCNVTNSTTFCDTCDNQSRIKDNITNLCSCKNGFYQTFTKKKCQSCFPCGTCQRKNTCITCLQKDQMILNPVKSQCQCKAGFYPNYIKNTTNYTKQKPCQKCSQNCLYCTNSTNCLACRVGTYLTNGSCIIICKQNQRFFQSTKKCQQYDGDLFDQNGRLGFDWSYKFEQNKIIIDLIFSQTDIMYYYFQNGKGYNYEDYKKQNANQATGQNNNDGSSMVYDDGINQNGFSDDMTDKNAIDGQVNGGINTGFNPIIDQSALRGEFFGLGQTAFIKKIYQNQTDLFRNQYNIPFGKYKLTQQNISSQANYLDALFRNLVFKISDQVIPYTIQGISNNRFVLRTRPIKTYINQVGSIQIKNSGLIRTNLTSLQKRKVEKTIERFDFYTGQQLSTAKSLLDNNQFLVGILWGISKYFLFIGFGWPFIPIMLVMQFIMGFNYINTLIPLNLNYFLASFKDFRNPSILYNPLRNQFDAQVLNHPNIYTSTPELQRFDRGLDFMKNSWQFFFIPFLAFCLLGLFYLLNQIFRKCCKKDFCLISKFLIPRAPFLIAAYTLIQALPVSFFFFSQLRDTTFRHRLEPNKVYPTFNTAMAYLAFFLTCAIPLFLLAWLYHHFNHKSRITKFSDANIFNQKFLKKIQNSSGEFSRAQLKDPLWGGDHIRLETYALGIGLFILPVLFGFFLAFFIHDFAWQIAGLIFFSALFLAFIIASSFFLDKIIKIFFIGILILMVTYLFLHAGLGSNRSLGTFDQWNTGYLGIGLIYALIITAILFTCYLIYKFLRQAYQSHLKYGCWTDIDKQNVQIDKDKQVERVQQYRHDTKLKSTFLKNTNTLKVLNSGAGGNSMNFANNQGFNSNRGVGSGNLNKGEILPELDDNLQSAQRLIQRDNPVSLGNILEQLILNRQDIPRNQVIFITKDTNTLYSFPTQNAQAYLLGSQPLYIDTQRKIYDRNKAFIDYYDNLIKVTRLNINSSLNIQSSANISSNIEMINLKKDQLLASNNVNKQFNSYKSINSNITTQKQIYNINGQQFEKISQQPNGNLRVKSLNTGQIMNFNKNNLSQQGSKLFITNNVSQSIIQSSKKIVSNLNLNQSSYKQIVNYQGAQYEQLGIDQEGRHRLYSQQLRKSIIMPHSQYMNLVNGNNGNSMKNSYNNLLLQSAVNNNLKGQNINSNKNLEEPQMKLISTSKNQYVFEDTKGKKLYVPKNKINDDLPLQVDQQGNISQNGKVVVSKSESQKPYQQKSSKNIISNQIISNQTISQPISSQLVTQEKYQEQVSSDQVINPNKFYKIIGISSNKVVNYEYKQKDVSFVEKNIQGNNIMDRIEQLQQKYPDFALLVKGQTDQNQEYWLA